MFYYVSSVIYALSYVYPTTILRVSYVYPMCILRVSYVYPMCAVGGWGSPSGDVFVGAKGVCLRQGESAGAEVEGV